MKNRFLLFDGIELATTEGEELLLFGEILHIFKHLERAGWKFRGVRGGESLAGHSYGVIMWSLWLARRHRHLHPDLPIDEIKLLRLSIVHDLPESLTGDLTPWQRELLFGKKGKDGVINSELRFWKKLMGKELTAPSKNPGETETKDNETETKDNNITKKSTTKEDNSGEKKDPDQYTKKNKDKLNSFFTELFEAWKEYRVANSIEAEIVKRADALDCVMQALFYRKMSGAPLQQFRELIDTAAGKDIQLKNILNTLWESAFSECNNNSNITKKTPGNK